MMTMVRELMETKRWSRKQEQVLCNLPETARMCIDAQPKISTTIHETPSNPEPNIPKEKSERIGATEDSQEDVPRRDSRDTESDRTVKQTVKEDISRAKR